MTLAALARQIRKASFALPSNHPDQGALYAAHEVLVSSTPTAAAPTPSVVTIHEGQAARSLGREQR
jgi:hypothetical protein